MAIRRWRPISNLLRLQREMDSLFEGSPRRESREFEWSPSVDVSESEDEIKIEADLPGMKREDIDVNIELTNVNTEDAEATFQNGILSLTLPKVEEEKGKKIEIEG